MAQSYDRIAVLPLHHGIGEARRRRVHTFIVELPAPFDVETMETLITVVKPMVEAAPIANVG